MGEPSKGLEQTSQDTTKRAKVRDSGGRPKTSAKRCLPLQLLSPDPIYAYRGKVNATIYG